MRRERERKSKHELGKQAGMQPNASNLSTRQGPYREYNGQLHLAQKFKLNKSTKQ